MIARRVTEAHLALVLLTRLPLPRLRDPVPSIGAAAWAFPLAGLAVALIAAAIFCLGLALNLPLPLLAGFCLAAQVLTTGALHEDGLADFADGFWGGTTPERRLEIMRDSRIGSYGTIALILGLGLRWQALAALTAHPAIMCLALVASAMASRAGASILLAALPAARSDGLGHSARDAGKGAAITAALMAVPPFLGLAAWAGPLVLPAMVLATGAVLWLVASLAKTRLGGQTGDVLGATQQLIEIAGLATVAAVVAL
ncbi:MAG: adenosylcobinamide-GDP ribazoletransferase [Thioclava sp.]|nr:adenosylcobinamide-GDP ribazoletransferase [Thioclava sp.]MBD3803861.1 adenosylcobinamide-GDP ribazoletransferase [Thioclava sp.]